MTRRMTDEELDALTERVADALDAPDPSPLFWEHFPDRVRAAVAADAPVAPPRVPWWRRPVAAATVATLIISVAGAGVWMQREASTGAARSVADASATSNAGIDAAWSVVEASAADIGLDDLADAGFVPGPGDADVAFEDLSQAERAVLFALLEAELGAGGRSGS